MKINTRLNIYKYALHPQVQALLVTGILGVSLLGITFQANNTSLSHKHTASRTVTITKTANHKLPPAAKGTKPAPAPIVATPPIKPAIVTPVPKSISAVEPTPVVVPSPGSSVSSLTPTPNTPPSGSSSSGSGSSNANPPVTTGYTSTNWSGYMTANGTFNEISASWMAPQVTGNNSTTSADSTWIGIGGVSSNDLIQVGTQNIVTANGQVSTAAFYELLPSVSQPIASLTVAAGDSMTASLTEISTNNWSIQIVDNTNNESFTVNVSYASSHSSAEWIEEDPSNFRNRLIPFDNFGVAAFTNGSAVSNGNSLNILGANAQEITMVNGAGQAIATPSVIKADGASFNVTQN